MFCSLKKLLSILCPVHAHTPTAQWGVLTPRSPSCSAPFLCSYRHWGWLLACCVAPSLPLRLSPAAWCNPWHFYFLCGVGCDGIEEGTGLSQFSQLLGGAARCAEGLYSGRETGSPPQWVTPLLSAPQCPLKRCPGPWSFCPLQPFLVLTGLPLDIPIQLTFPPFLHLLTPSFFHPVPPPFPHPGPSSALAYLCVSVQVCWPSAQIFYESPLVSSASPIMWVMPIMWPQYLLS